MEEKKQVPQIRFKGYVDAWEQRKWSDSVDISTEMVDPKTGIYDELPHVAPGNIAVSYTHLDVYKRQNAK